LESPKTIRSNKSVGIGNFTEPKIKNMSVEKYLADLPEDRQQVIKKLDQLIRKNLKGKYEAGIQYGMIGYYIPHKVYPAGYHCNPKEPLPFIQIASQKNFVALYHMGMYAEPTLLAWFEESYAKLGIGKPDMGKSCIRFKKMDKIPFELLGELVARMSTDAWIALYERMLKK
jgi:hypothetical protein